MKRKGFTLIELLAVIVILAIIALIAVPVIMNIITSARESAFEDTAYGLISAGEMYYASSLLNDGITGTKVFTFTEDGSVPEGLNVKGDMPKSGVLEVTKDGKTALAITNGSLCIIKGYNDSKLQVLEEFEACELPPKTLSELAKTNDFATTVNACATSGTCAVGTKFAIEVAPGNIQNFYVINDENNTVTLMMNSNIGDKIQWVTQADYELAGGNPSDWGTDGNNTKGPITALNYLEEQTAEWTNIVEKDYTLNDFSLTRANAKARLITETEARTISFWYTLNISTSEVFWTSAFIDAEKTATNAMFISGLGMTGITQSFGVRPVIEISK